MTGQDRTCQPPACSAASGQTGKQGTVLVVGGGIGGLAAALALHKAGLQVEVFEQAPVPAEVGAGINILPGAVQVLHDLGLADALKSTEKDGGAGVQTSELVYCANTGTVILREKRGLEAGCTAPQYSIHRGWLHMMLLATARERLGESHVHCGHHFQRLEQTADSVTAHFRVPASDAEKKSPWVFTGTASFTGDFMIGADGLKSKVRAHLFPGEKAVFTGWRIYRGVLEVDSQIYDGKSMLLYGTGKAACVLYPVCERRRKEGKTLLNWGINCHNSILKPEMQGEPPEESWTRRVKKDEFSHLVDGWAFPKGSFPDPSIDFSKLIKDTPDDCVTCYALFDRDPISTWTVGRVSVLGDAAHPLLPFGSQGAGQALLDVAALYDAVTGCKGDWKAALKTYEAARADAAAKVVLTNRGMGPTKLLKMFEDAVGTKTLAEQEEWVKKHQSDIAGFSNDYRQNVSAETGSAPIGALGVGTPFDGKMGFGKTPMLLIVDFCLAYTKPGSPWYCPDPACGVVSAVDASVELLAKVRAKGLPVVYTKVVFDKDGADDSLMFLQKVPAIRCWTEDNPLTNICPEVAPIAGETVMIKKSPSAFHGTNLQSWLTARGVDTVLLVGCSTSGCIRATAWEGMQNGFRVVVPRECVGDRTVAVHDANLLDCHAKICDVLPKSEVMDYLDTLPATAKKARIA